jgi:hypothetical protein
MMFFMETWPRYNINNNSHALLKGLKNPSRWCREDPPNLQMSNMFHLLKRFEIPSLEEVLDI